MMVKAPERITYTDGHSFCPGCGHGIAIRLIGEVLQELGREEEAIAVLDVACGGMPIDIWRYDTIEAAHGRPVPTAVGVSLPGPKIPSLPIWETVLLILLELPRQSILQEEMTILL